MRRAARLPLRRARELRQGERGRRLEADDGLLRQAFEVRAAERPHEKGAGYGAFFIAGSKPRSEPAFTDGDGVARRERRVRRGNDAGLAHLVDARDGHDAALGARREAAANILLI